MTIKLIPSPTYNMEKKEIAKDIFDFAMRRGENAEQMLRYFKKDERDLLKRIKAGPLRAGVDFPKPVKKGTTESGKYVVLYTCLPPEASTNSDVTRVNLDSILVTASSKFNELFQQLEQADFKDES